MFIVLVSLFFSFFERFGFPGILGAIDGTHIAIVTPVFGGIPPAVVYLNRKNFFSINCQIVIENIFYN